MPIQPEPKVAVRGDEHRIDVGESLSVSQQRVQEFVLSALRQLGQNPKLVDGVWCCPVEGALLSVFSTPELRMVFDQDLAEKVLDAVYVTAGSEVFEKLVAIVANQVSVANLAYLDRSFWRIPASVWLPIIGVSVEITSRRLFFQRQVLFHFRVRLVADETEEFLMPILIDPLTEEANVVPPLEKTISLGNVSEFLSTQIFLPDRKDYELLQTQCEKVAGKISYSLQRLYQAACVNLEKQMMPVVTAFQRKVSERQREEIERLQAYYQGRRMEALFPLRRLFRRMTGLRAKLDMARTLQSEARYTRQVEQLKLEISQAENEYHREIAMLDEELQLRVAELQARYRLRVEVDLVSAAYLWVPRWEFSCYLIDNLPSNKSNEGRQVRDFIGIYDLLRQEFVNLTCEHCGHYADYLFLCSEGDLVCSHCIGACGGCGSRLCGECAAGYCHICGEPVCGDCAISCPVAVADHRFRSSTAQDCVDGQANVVMVCPQCRRQYCSMCRRLVGDSFAQ